MTAEVIPFVEPPRTEPCCSFCGLKQSQVERLFTNSMEGSQAKAICNRCVVKAKDRLMAQRKTD